MSDVTNDLGPNQAPPTQPGEVQRAARPTVWPKWIGIILIVLGSLAAAGAAIGMLMPLLFGMLGDWLESVDPQISSGMFGAMSDSAGLMIVGQALGLVAAILAIFAGLALLKKRPNGPKLAITWAILKIGVGVLNTGISVLINMAQFKNMEEMDPNTAQMQPMMLTMTIFGGVMGLVWICALPVFILAWFSRAKIKDEVATWQHPS